MNGSDLANLLQQSMMYRQANAKPVGQTGQMRAPMFINPMTAQQPQPMPQQTQQMQPQQIPTATAPAGGMMSGGGMSGGGMGGGGGMDLASMLGQAQQYMQNRRGGGRNAAMASALRRSAMGEY